MNRKVTKFIHELKPFDRRRYPRFNVPEIRCICVYAKEGTSIECESSIFDISKAGVLMMTGEEKILPSNAIEIRVPVSSLETISLRGRIVRTYRIHMQHWYYSGVCFLGNQDAQINKLLDLALSKLKIPEPPPEPLSD